VAQGISAIAVCARLFLLATSLDVFVLSAIVEADQVGIYFAAAKIVTCVSFIQMAVGAAITRRLSEALQQENQSAFTAHFERGSAMMMWPTLAGVIIVSLASPLILKVFGPEFAPGAPVVVILSAGLLIQAVAGPIQERMMVMGQQRAIAWIIAGSLLFNVVTSIALTLIMGLMGTARGLGHEHRAAYLADALLFAARPKACPRDPPFFRRRWPYRSRCRPPQPRRAPANTRWPAGGCSRPVQGGHPSPLPAHHHST
jgi:Na+-driven multidrug efflux pump